MPNKGRPQKSAAFLNMLTYIILIANVGKMVCRGHPCPLQITSEDKKNQQNRQKRRKNRKKAAGVRRTWKRPPPRSASDKIIPAISPAKLSATLSATLFSKYTITLSSKISCDFQPYLQGCLRHRQKKPRLNHSAGLSVIGHLSGTSLFLRGFPRLLAGALG